MDNTHCWLNWQTPVTGTDLGYKGGWLHVIDKVFI